MSQSDGAAKKGLRMRRPGERVQEEAIRALEAEAERIASKAPGSRDDIAPAAAPVVDVGEVPVSSEPAASERKVQITAYLPADVRDELRRAAVALSGPPTHETVTSIVERAIRQELDRLRRDHGDFPNTSVKPRPGRRAGV